MSSWRDRFKIHPACELFPMMSEAELKELGEDIKKYGLVEKIKIIDKTDHNDSAADQVLVVVDGRNRLDAMEMVGIERDFYQHFEEVGPLDDDEVAAFVISANIRRRHLTAEQGRDIIAKVLKLKPDMSNRQIAEMVNRDHKTVGAVRENLEATGEIPQLQKTVGKDGKSRKQLTPKTVSVKPPPPPTPTQRVEEKIRQAAIADKKKNGDLSLTRVMDEVVTTAEREELVALANHSAPERHVPARQWCENHGIEWQPPPSAEQTAEERKALYASNESSSQRRTIDRVRPESEAPAAVQDFLSPADADRGIILIAERLDSGLFLPSPGILDCLKQAIARASPKHRNAIKEAAYTLSELAEAASA